MNRITLCTLLIGVPTLAGCDSLYAIDRSAPVAAMPDLACVEQAIRQSPEIIAVERGRSPDNAFTYRGDSGSEIDGTIALRQDSQGRVTFSDTYFTINQEPSRSRVDATRRAMLGIEGLLAAQCGMHELPAKITESCSLVECPPIP